MATSEHIHLMILAEEPLMLNLDEQRYEIPLMNEQQRTQMFFKLIENYLKLKGDIKE